MILEGFGLFTTKKRFTDLNLSMFATVGNRNMIALIFYPGWISILEAGISAGSASHINMFPPFNIFSMSFTFSVQLCHLLLYILFLVCQPLSLSHFWSTQCSLTHIPSVCLFLILSLISILQSMTWRRIGCNQPSSCVLLVLRHDRGALANLLSICLEELKDALSPGTSGLQVARRSHIRNCTQ